MASLSLKPRACLLVILTTATCISAPAFGQDDEYARGLIGTFTDGKGRAVRRVDEQIALRWSGTPAVRGLEAGKFTANWRGFLMSQNNGEYRISVFLQGEIKMTLAGQTVLSGRRDKPGWIESKAIPLEFDFHACRIQFSGTGEAGGIQLFWSGPNFQREPIPPKHLHHAADKTPSDPSRQGELLIRSLRCSNCHVIHGEPKGLPAPSLSRLGSSINPGWLEQHLSGRLPAGGNRMPGFVISKTQARQLSAYLIGRSKAAHSSPKSVSRKKKPVSKGKKGRKKKGPDAANGKRLVLTLGCLACHQLDGLGQRGWFDGGDLTSIATKRPADFFSRWLARPADINPDHRMPVFSLNKREIADISAHLKTRGKPMVSKRLDVSEDTAAGRQLFQSLRCAACHDAARDESKPKRKRLQLSQLADSCLDEPSAKRPGYRLAKEKRKLVVATLQRLQNGPATSPVSARRLLAENNCLSCHANHQSRGLGGIMTSISKKNPHLQSLLAAMTPPSLISVGDKLYRKSLAEMILRSGPVHRPWLLVRMPKFRLSPADASRLVEHFVTLDRIPAYRRAVTKLESKFDSTRLDFAGTRLVTTDGFGCTSCHQVGSVQPPKAPLNARGPSLSMMSKRIRRSWFDRWVRNPIRIVPRMEMPSVQLAVKGVLHDSLDDQLSAVWRTLNQPGFQPPPPGALRTVRHTGQRPADPAVFLTDVVYMNSLADPKIKRSYIKPFLVGLPGRHNLLYDLSAGRVVAWTIGDVAQQRTEGKTWLWTLAGNTLAESPNEPGADIVIEQDGKVYEAQPRGQFVTEFDWVRQVKTGLDFQYRLTFDTKPKPLTISVTEKLRGTTKPGRSGITRIVSVGNVPKSVTCRLRVNYAGRTGKSVERAGRVVLDDRSAIFSPHQQIKNGSLVMGELRAGKEAIVHYSTSHAIDRFPLTTTKIKPPPAIELNVVPGFQAIRLPLAADIMPTGLSWRPQGELMISSLKGRVWTARDTNGDGMEDKIVPFSAELAAPFGLAAKRDYVDVINKYSLLRLFDDDGDGRADRHVTLSSGWGHTADYHDWAVGLPQDSQGNYLIAVSCQQDKRSAAAAKMRGTVLKLVPRKPTVGDPRRFAVQQISGGHRFPIGIALRQDGELFVTDNQGNYNPFNELNHVRQGVRFGFINSIDRKPGFAPPLTPPAIDIPHPWTRSVNGICFLQTPATSQGERLARFGPFENHLIGCEYDTRRLIRMSLQKVNGRFQGAAYPFSFDKPKSGEPLLGPLACAVSPRGELYIGSIRDSGWGGSNNIGSLVKLEYRADRMPLGIAEVRAIKSGFEIAFTKDFAPSKAKASDNYSVSSYTRVSTPRYGGNDRDRRVEKVASVRVVSPRRIRLSLAAELRENFVYEFRLKNIGRGKIFFPAEAYYTLRSKVQ